MPDPNRHLANRPDSRDVTRLQVVEQTRKLVLVAFHSAAEPIGALSFNGGHRIDQQRQKMAAFRTGTKTGRAVRANEASNNSRDAPGSKFGSKKVCLSPSQRVRGGVRTAQEGLNGIEPGEREPVGPTKDKTLLMQDSAHDP